MCLFILEMFNPPEKHLFWPAPDLIFLVISSKAIVYMMQYMLVLI